jgi:CheY-like chemotaxis protein
MTGGGKLTIELANASLDAAYAAAHAEVAPGQYVMLAITDTGTGMAREVAERAFEPFYTTKPEGVGTGLGLSMVYGFAKQSGGHVKIYSEVGHGTTVKLYLPRTQRAEAARLPPAEAVPRGNGETVLVAEDDDGVRAAAITQLAELGYRVLSAANGDDALAILARGERIDLLFTDVVMSGSLNGRMLADKARQLLPDLRVVFTSGYTENAIIHHGRLDEGVSLLNKPYRLAQLAEAIHAELRRPVAAAKPAASVLVVEDDDKVRALTVALLDELGFHAAAAARPGEALSALEADPAITAMVTDFNLPEYDGGELARRALALRPDLRIVIASGRALGSGDLPDPAILVLRKPFRAADLAEAIGRG